MFLLKFITLLSILLTLGTMWVFGVFLVVPLTLLLFFQLLFAGWLFGRPRNAAP